MDLKETLKAGKELDALMAQVFFNKRIFENPFGLWATDTKEGDCVTRGDWLLGPVKPWQGIHPWSPSSNMNHAMEIIHEIKLKGWSKVFDDNLQELSKDIFDLNSEKICIAASKTAFAMLPELAEQDVIDHS